MKRCQQNFHFSYEQTWFMAYNAVIHGTNEIVVWGTPDTPSRHSF